MERQEQGGVRTEDLASGGGGGAAATEQQQPTAPPAETAEPREPGGSGGADAAGAPQQGTAGAGGAEGTSTQEAPAGAGGAETAGAHDTSAGAPGATAERGDDASTPLLPDHEARDFEGRWHEVQVGFVDEPQRCVKEADGLVAEVMQRLADGFAHERRELESQWGSGGEVSTEDLRVALQRYRSFFNRLLRTG
jgi:hypothetical protein